MPEMPKRKYLIAGGVVTVLVIITIVLLAVLLPQSDDDGNSSANISSVAPPTEETTTEEATTEPERETPMLDMLDAMQQLMTGEEKFDRDFYDELRECMESFDSRLPAAGDGAWQGMIDYWNSNGTEEDHWGGFDTVYLEQNVTETNLLGMTIYEPCNYASNVAFYHVVTEFCSKRISGEPVSIGEEYIQGFGKAFSTLAMGSAFMHGSHTNLGGQQDTGPIKVIALMIHQSSISAIPNASCVLTDLSETPRKYSGLDLAEEFVKMHLNLPVYEWYDYTDAFEMPNYYLIFSGIFTTVLTMAYDEDIVDKWIPIFSDAFGVPEDDQAFIIEKYLPELRNATSDSEFFIDSDERENFMKDAWATVFKLIYAFLWQEEVLTDNPLFLSKPVNKLGMKFLPVLNNFLDEGNSFEYFDLDFQNGVNVYPGDEWCDPVGPHAKWHLESALGLMDLTYLGDEMYRILSDNL